MCPDNRKKKRDLKIYDNERILNLLILNNILWKIWKN